MKLKKVLVMNGPNLDMLGTREPEVYGTVSLEKLEKKVAKHARKQGVKVSCCQSNSEGKLINAIHKAPAKFDAIVYNPGAHTHYSYALRDAVASIELPVVEVHLSNVGAREPFRATSVIAPACVAQIKGRGIQGYCDAIDLLLSAQSYERLGESFETRFPQGEVVSAVVVALPADVEAESAEANTGDGESEGDEAAEESDDEGDRDADAACGISEPAPHADKGVGQDSECVDAHAVDVRLANLRKACDEQGLSAFLVRDTPAIAWLTGFDDVFDEERAHALLVTPHAAQLHTDSRYANACRRASEAAASSIVIDERVSHAAFVRAALTCASDTVSESVDDDAALQANVLGIEDDIALAEYRKLEEELAGTSVELRETNQLVLGLRAVKDADEIARMKAAQAITDVAFAHIVTFMRIGMTEREVQIELEDFMVRNGADGLAFPSIVATGANGANPHAIPGDTVLEAGQCVVLDFGARFKGYCSDMTRTVFLGEPTDEMRRAWETLVRANVNVQQLIKPGVTGAEMHEEAERALEEGGFGGAMGHGLGHGVGMQVHEMPLLSPRYDKPLAVGNVVTVEPGIYLPGKFGMRLEDFGVVTHEGYERFTQSTHDMVIIERL